MNGGGPWGAALMCAAGLALPATAAGQGARTCDVVIDRTGGVGRQVDIGGGRYRIYQSGGVWAHCRGQTTSMYADSVAYYPELERFDMVGGVRFRDSTAELTSQRANYYLRDERLEAHGNARLRNLETGSLLRGPNLTYRRKASGVRDTAELRATSRPTIEWREMGDTAGAEPYVIVADRVRLLGNERAWAAGTVTIDRSDFHARADSAALDMEAGQGRLVGGARVEGTDSSYVLTGRTVAFRLVERTLRWVQAEQDAQSVSEEWRLTADTIQFDLERDLIQRGTAWGDSARPQAVSERSTITGDSLAITAPDQQLAVVRAIGRALATAKRDSLDAEGDWVAGDSVTARFDSSATGGRELTRLEAIGNGRTRYRIYETGGDVLAGINYSRGTRIVATFRDDALDKVVVWGQSDGVYLEARRPGDGERAR